MTAPDTRHQQAVRRARPQADARRRAEAEREQKARRQLLLQQWQRANIVFAISVLTLAATIPYVALVLIGLRWDLGIPTRVGEVWLMGLVAGWFATLVMGAYTVYTTPSMDRRARSWWTLAVVVPLTTLPAAIAFGHRRRGELHADVKEAGLLAGKQWWKW